MKPLADTLRPTSFNEIYGHNYLVGENGILLKMIEKKKYHSFILYGPPGSGKTTIAKNFAALSLMDTYFFNASIDNKKKLTDIIKTTIYHDILLIIDEIHRMKSDIQDYLLPYLENGKVIVIGLTASNPYYSVNPAIRSRLNLYELKKLENDDIKNIILKALNKINKNIIITKDALDLLVRFSNNDARSALNKLDDALLYLDNKSNKIDIEIVNKILGKSNLDLDNSGDNYYKLLSALQKSIRGSDVNASIHYLAKLVLLGDLDSICRRLIVICYEDIGLANPNMGPKVCSACEAVKKIGLPEARILLSNIVIDMALSPKSNSAITAIDLAISDVEKGGSTVLPDYLDNNKIKLNPKIYKYPHDDKGGINNQSYLPHEIKDKIYYKPTENSKYEKALKERYKFLQKLKYNK